MTKNLSSRVWVGLVSASLLFATACTCSLMQKGSSQQDSFAKAAPYARDVVTVEKPGPEACSKVLSAGGGRWQGHAAVSTTDSVYCRYSWIGAGASAPDLEGLSRLGEYEVDFPVISASALPSPEAEFQAQYRQQTGRVSYTSDVTAAPRSPVWVAVIDSAAHTWSEAAVDTFGHGRAVGNVVHDLACGDLPDEKCGLHIENTLAMPQIDKDNFDYVNGGYFGSRMQLVDALEATLAAWNKDRAKSNAKLVINLSLGWDQLAQDRFPAPRAAAAVKIALRRAACSGALIFAAAGNRSPFSKHGALYPAAWEDEAAPDAAACRRVGIQVDRKDVKGDRGVYAPLLFAVGGVDQHDVPLVTTRVGGQARLTAYGLAVVTDDVRPTKAYSGSSMATAVLSGVAAAAWSYNPSLSSAEVAAKLYASGNVVDPIYAVPSVCLGGVACHTSSVRRVSVCAGLEAVGVSSTCTPPGAMPMPPTTPPLPVVAACSGLTCGPPVPNQGDPGAGPWVKPQPGDPLCPSCEIDRSGGILNVKMKGTLAPWAAWAQHYMYVVRYSSVYLLAEDARIDPAGVAPVNMPLTGENPFWPTTQAELQMWLNLGATWVWIGSQQLPVL